MRGRGGLVLDKSSKTSWGKNPYWVLTGFTNRRDCRLEEYKGYVGMSQEQPRSGREAVNEVA